MLNFIRKNFKILGVLVLIVLVFWGVKIFKTIPEEVNPYINSKIETKTFQVNGTWGYDVLIDGHIYVHQPNVPAVGGGAGFKTEEDAQKTAEFVVDKIRKNILPPSVDQLELQSLGVLK